VPKHTVALSLGFFTNMVRDVLMGHHSNRKLNRKVIRGRLGTTSCRPNQDEEMT
jgi:hypothetical protein